MKIIVDADACPQEVLNTCREIGRQKNIPVFTVANFNHQIIAEHHLMVGNNPQEADLKIINLTQAGDLAVTQDWGLAAVLLGKGAHVLHPLGWKYNSKTIDFLLEERAAKAKFRRGGGRTRGPAKRTAEDDRKFKAALLDLLD